MLWSCNLTEGFSGILEMRFKANKLTMEKWMGWGERLINLGIRRSRCLGLKYFVIGKSTMWP